jgi:hypothetical protein
MLAGVKTRATRLVVTTLTVLPLSVTAFLLQTAPAALADGPRMR